MGIIRFIIWVTWFINLLTKSLTLQVGPEVLVLASDRVPQLNR